MRMPTQPRATVLQSATGGRGGSYLTSLCIYMSTIPHKSCDSTRRFGFMHSSPALQEVVLHHSADILLGYITSRCQGLSVSAAAVPSASPACIQLQSSTHLQLWLHADCGFAASCHQCVFTAQRVSQCVCMTTGGSTLWQIA